MQQPPQGGFLMEKLPMKRKNKKQIIGIIGGMGPEASNYLYKTLIDLSIKHFDAENNDDFPEIILYSIPVPDFISNRSERKIAFEMLKRRVIRLNNFNILYFAIACNTVHILLDDLRKISKAPFLSMIDEVVKQVNIENINKIGLLATPFTIKYALYQRALKEKGIDTIIPSRKEQGFLEKIIRNVLKGDKATQDQEKLLLISDSLRQRGAGGIILGCTELPLIFPESRQLPIFNSVEILAMALLRKFYK